ncbi:MAG: hypothetical protein WBL95_26950 [Microcoleus sp.]
MSKYDDIGKLMYLPLASIEPGELCSESEFIITAAAEAILNSGGLNWIPVIVKETGDDQYQVVSNSFIYAVAQQAELKRVWCIIIEPESKNIEQAKILAREAIPKVNLSTESRDTILAALGYLVAQPGSALKGLDVMVAANRISAANRETWSNFNPITTLRCGITRGKKLDALATVFYLSPPAPLAPPPPPPEKVSVKRASRDEIFDRLNYLSTNKIGGFENIDAEKTADAIFNANKGKWKSLTPIPKLEPGLDTAKMKTFKTLFTL